MSQTRKRKVPSGPINATRNRKTENVERAQCRLCGEPCPLNMALWERDFRVKVEDITCEPIPDVARNKATTRFNACEPCQSMVEEFYRYKLRCRMVLEGRMEELKVDELLERCEVEITLPQDTLDDIGIESEQRESEELEEPKVEQQKRRYRARHRKTEEEKAMSPDEFKKHLQKLYGSRYKVQCEICHQKLAKSCLDGHMNRHYGLEPYVCPHCELRFHCQLNMRRHEARNHAPKEDAIPCDVCGKLIQSRIALKQHMKSHLEKQFECQECGVRAPNEHTLKRHMDIHNQVRDHVCPECGKTFYRPYVLRIHLRTHSGETPYFCNLCQRGFVHRRVYVSHMKKQHPAEPLMRLDIAKGWKESTRSTLGM